MFSTYGSGIRRAGLVAVIAAVVLLWVPATGFAAGASGTRRPALAPVAQAGTAPLARWAGYWTPAAHTRAEGLEKRRVRVVQRVLTRLGKRPGPVDGLFGPLTEAGVVRFQRSVGIAADGVVGRRTARRLLAAAARLSDTRLARQRGAAPQTRQFASARLPRGGTAAPQRAGGFGCVGLSGRRSGPGGRGRAGVDAGAGAAFAARLGAAGRTAGTGHARPRAEAEWRHHEQVSDDPGRPPAGAGDHRPQRPHRPQVTPASCRRGRSGDRRCGRSGM